MDLPELLTVTEPRYSPSVRRRRLSRELRNLREAQGLTADEVTRRLEWSQGKLSSMETNKWRRPNPRDIRDLCELYSADEATQEALMAMARESRKRGWWEEGYGDVLGSGYIGFEQEARVYEGYQPLVIPGLLQTPAYIRALARADLARDTDAIERMVEMRATRQRILTHADPLRMWAVIDEAALSRPFGTTAERREQLQRLADTDAMENVTVQVLPFSAGLHAGMACGFVILSYKDDPSIVHIETGGGNALFLERPEDLERHSVRFQHLQATALGPDESVRFILDMIKKSK
ncbi:helix-turn-helix domain-containing protein [Actinomadura nitritigenes]|jgi:transcriptional regulator with XRE-family HTH domain|uniref:helix-turn-helix domain-containing protein n=1 Tax=Actinomadura nitritigenes TaxID=134602 RepID=UPI0036C486A3